MITLSIIIALSFSIIASVLFALSAIYWFSLWRRRRAGIAQCLFLTNTLLAMTALLKLFQIISYIINGGNGGNHFNLLIGFIVVCVAVMQFALSKGYFTVQE